MGIDKPVNHAVMPHRTFGERERFPHHAPDPLAQGVVPSLHVRGLVGLLAHALAASFGKDVGVGLPKIAVATAATVTLGYPTPKFPAGRLVAPITVDECHDLPGPSAQGCPRPHLVAPFPHIAAYPLASLGTGFVKLKYATRPCGDEAVRHLRQPTEFFNHATTVGATPRTCTKSRAGSTAPGTPA